MHCKTTSRPRAGLAAFLALAAIVTASGASAFEVRSYAQGEALLGEKPANPGVYMAYAGFLAELGERARAVDVLERGRARAEPSVELLVALGEHYRDLELWPRAETVANEAVELDPEYADAHVLMGEVYFAQGWNRSGLESFRAAMVADPAATRPRVRLLGGLVDDGQDAAAEEECLRFIAIDPENAALWMALGRIFEHQHKHREAFATYGQVLTIDPMHSDAYARQGKLFCEFGQYQAAEATCRQALELDARCALAHAYLGIALSHLGRTDEALHHAQIAEASGLNMTSVWRKIAQ